MSGGARTAESARFKTDAGNARTQRSALLQLHFLVRLEYFANVKSADLQQAVLALPERKRASLAAKILASLPAPGTDISDEEVERRELELETGRVAAISHQEFVRSVNRLRGR